MEKNQKRKITKDQRQKILWIILVAMVALSMVIAAIAPLFY